MRKTLSIRPKEFVKAARAAHALITIIAIATLRPAPVMLAEANLSFLRLGAKPPTPSWGTI